MSTNNKPNFNRGKGKTGKPNYWKEKKPKVDRRLTNDYKWWSKYPRLIKDAGEFTYVQIGGSPCTLSGYSATRESIPNVMRFNYLPTIGKSTTAQDAFMSQVRNLWLDMHRKYRGIGSYESADLGAFIFCAINLFANIARAEKIYGYFRGQQATNRAIPFLLLNAMGVDYTSNSAQLADFRANLDLITQKAADVCLPKGFSAYEDAVMLASITVKDSENERAGLYTFDSPYFYVFSGTSYQTGSACIAHSRTFKPGAQYQQLDDIITDLNTQLEVLLLDSDCVRMCSDILAAYEANGVEKRQGIDPEYLSPIGKDDIRLLQIHNMTLCGGVYDTTTGSHQVEPTNAKPTAAVPLGTPNPLDIVQVNNVLIEDLFLSDIVVNGYVYSQDLIADAAVQAAFPDLHRPYEYTVAGGMLAVTNNVPQRTVCRVYDRLVDTWQDDVDQETKVEMTRFTVPITQKTVQTTVSGVTTENVYTHLENFGTNIIIGMSLFSKDSGALDACTVTGLSQCITPLTPTLDTYLGLSHFDWHPIVYRNTLTTPPTSANTSYVAEYVSTGVLGDLDHFAVIRNADRILEFLHYAAVMSAFRCELVSNSLIDTI